MELMTDKMELIGSTACFSSMLPNAEQHAWHSWNSWLWDAHHIRSCYSLSTSALTKSI